MEKKIIGVATDHAGFPLKQFVLQYLEKNGYEVKDYGTWRARLTAALQCAVLARVSL